MSIAFKVEDGTGYVDSNSYASTDFANSYHTLYGNAVWAGLGLDGQQEALVQATQSIDLLYGPDFYSLPMSHSGYLQALLFPRFTLVINRIQVVQAGTIPVQLKNAACEVALMYTNGVNVFPQPNTLRFIRSQQVRVGGLETNTGYAVRPDAEHFTGFWKIEQILRPILRKSDVPSYLSL
jgi:hypothetical protein